jgi:hypothetical protein
MNVTEIWVDYIQGFKLHVSRLRGEFAQRNGHARPWQLIVEAKEVASQKRRIAGNGRKKVLPVDLVSISDAHLRPFLDPMITVLNADFHDEAGNFIRFAAFPFEDRGFEPFGGRFGREEAKDPVVLAIDGVGASIHACDSRDDPCTILLGDAQRLV